MSGTLLAYPHVPVGFEVVVDRCVETGKIWNLWINTTQSHDTATWDREIRLVNEIQSRLDDVSTDQRLVRAHVAELCRVHPLFPRSVDLLCGEIGTEHCAKPLFFGCEGRLLLETLGLRDRQILEDTRREILAAYAGAARAWLDGRAAAGLLDAKVSGFLGQATEPKSRVVREVLSAIEGGDSALPRLKDLAARLSAEAQGEPLPDRPGRPLNCLACDGCAVGENGPKCQCSQGMLIDAILLCAGSADIEGTVRERFCRLTEECVLAYALAIDSWLRGAAFEPVTSVTKTRYISDDLARSLAAKVHAALGEKNAAKEWLAAGLLKTVTANQRWHKRAELIDGFPQATSWFRERLSG